MSEQTYNVISRNGNYHFDCRLNGKRYRKSLKTKSKSTADRRALKVFTKLNEENKETSSFKTTSIRIGDTLSTFVENVYFVEKRKEGLSEKSILRYGNSSRLFIKYIEDMHISDINNVHLERFKTELLKNGYANSTINAELRQIKLILNFATSKGHSNVEFKVKHLKKIPKQKNVLSTEDIIVIRAMLMDDKPMLDLFNFLLNTGCRIFEALELEAKKINKGVITFIGKKKIERRFPINETLQEILKDKPQIGLIFTGLPSRNELITRFSNIMDQLGYTDHDATHIIRRTFITVMIQKGVDIVTVGELTGHEDTFSLKKEYIHLFTDHLVNATKNISL